MTSVNESSNLFQNPILPGFHPDPSICRVGQDYFLVNSSFAYFPGVPLFHSRDLVHWHQIGNCLSRQDQLPLEHARISGGIFAPSIRYHDGTYFMITTNTTDGGNFYVTTRDPFGEWSDPIWVAQGGIDPSLLFYEGRVYLTTQGFATDDSNPAKRVPCISQSEIEIETGRLLTEPQPLWKGTGGASPEGPHLYKIGAYYYLMIAEGGTEYGHTEVMARSKSPWGPWESCPHNPILTHRSTDKPIQALGHADLVEAQDGSWWLVCLGVRTNGYPPVHHLGRETFLAPVTWDADGWPNVGNSGRIELEMQSPLLAPITWTAPIPRDDFDGQKLGLKWNFLGNPHSDDWSLTHRPGALSLRCCAASLDDGFGVVFVGCRQEHFDCEVATSLSFAPEVDGEEAGLTVWMDSRHHYDLFVSCENGTSFVSVRRRIGSLTAVVACEKLLDDQVTLLVRANRLLYALFVVSKNGDEHILAFGETRYLSTEVAGGFAGVYFALYASGNGRNSTALAEFDWFDYRDRAQPGILNIDCRLGDLLTNDLTKDVLNRIVPDLVNNPPGEWFVNIPLIGIAAMLPEAISPHKLLLIDTALRELRVVLRDDR